MFQVTSIPLATSTVVEHNEELCLKELSAHPGLSQGKDTHGSSPGVNSPSGAQDCSASSHRSGLPQPTKSHCTKLPKSSWVGINGVNKGPDKHQASSSVLASTDLRALGSVWAAQQNTRSWFQVVAGWRPQSRVGFDPFFLPLPLKNSF